MGSIVFSNAFVCVVNNNEVSLQYKRVFENSKAYGSFFTDVYLRQIQVL